MTIANTQDPLRISRIAGRYLIFEADTAARLRREHNINGLLTGTTPQQPTQNIFLGLPVEIRPEDAGALVQKGVAYVVDGAVAHREALSPARREAYVESLRKKKFAAERALAEQKSQKAAEAASRFVKHRKSKAEVPVSGSCVDEGESTVFEQDALHATVLPTKNNSAVAITPTSSEDMLSEECFIRHIVHDAPNGPLVRLLQKGGYFMTPGLRFGSQYSVYPGDPLRFHAHFMANQYDWDQPIPMLEVVEGGRLATAVKKAFLIGGGDSSDVDTEQSVRTFSIEWAAM